jgi:hypothetical protein
MARDFIDDLLNALHRVVVPDHAPLREMLIVCGMPEVTQNLRYLCFNRQVLNEDGRGLTFSVLAVINNRRIGRFRLEGYRRRLGRLVFHRLWTFNPLDYYLNSLRCDGEMMNVLERAPSRYTLLGILRIEADHAPISRPVVAVPGLDMDATRIVAAFESRHEIRDANSRVLPLFWKTTRD